MKKIFVLLMLIIYLFGLTGCNDDSRSEVEIENPVVSATLDEEGNIIIDEKEITEIATFISYQVDEITI